MANFHTLRVHAGLDPAQVAAEFRVSLNVVAEWESGMTRPPENVLRSLKVISQLSPMARPSSFGVVDLFSGAGGLSLGLHVSGFTTTLAVEMDRWAAETFQANFPNASVVQRDLETFTDEEILQFGGHSPRLIAGGPPCQGFSHSNIVNRDPKDPRNSLFREFLRWANLLRPEFCLLENVPGLLTSRTAAGDVVIDVIRQGFSNIGYATKCRVLQAGEYGVPQKRERLFLVAGRSGALIDRFEWPEPTHRLSGIRGQGLRPAVRLWEAISDLPEGGGAYASESISDYQAQMRLNGPTDPTFHEPMRHTRRVVARFQRITFGESEASVDSDLLPRKRGGGGTGKAYGQNSRRQHPNQPCNTVVASSHTNFIHPYFDRNFTVRELMRIQSFPDWYIMKGKRAVLSKKLSMKKGYVDDVFLDQRMQIGNAVPPRLASVVGQALMTAILNVHEDSYAA